MKYLIYGAGGTGGCLAAFLAQGGKDVSLIARGTHLEAIQKNGLVLETGHGTFAVPVEAREQEQITEKPDVIFVCVKGYSLEGTLPTLKRLSDGHTIVIPLLNIYGTGARLQPELSPALVTDGCIYIAAEIKAPGTVHMSGDIFRVVFGPRTPEEYRPAELHGDMEEHILVRKLFFELADEERLIIAMHVFGGYKSHEIARLLKMNENTVRSKESRGLKKLAGKLQGGAR